MITVVTGATGHIGAHLARAQMASGWRVRPLDAGSPAGGARGSA